jgi:hypothetical protein
LKQRHCCRETLDRNGADTRGGRKRKSISAAKIRKDAIFARAFKDAARMERSVIRDCHEASMPPWISLRSIRATTLPRIIDAPSQCLSIEIIQMGLADPGFGGNFY